MKNHFTLFLQLPKPKKIGAGRLDIDRKGEAAFWADGGTRCVAELSQPRILFAGTVGIMLFGMEPNGEDKTGRKKYTYQEWWLAYVE